MHVRVLGGDAGRVDVLLYGMHADPRELVLARQSVPVERLVLVPDDGQIERRLVCSGGEAGLREAEAHEDDAERDDHPLLHATHLPAATDSEAACGTSTIHRSDSLRVGRT